MKSVYDIVRSIIDAEAESLKRLSESLDCHVNEFVDAIYNCEGNLFFIGVGKSENVAMKIASTMNSIGVPAFSFSPLDICHGSLGAISADDIVIAISNSGETEELLECVDRIVAKGVRVLSVVGRESSSIAEKSSLCVVLKSNEIGPFGLVPASSVVDMMAFGDGVVAAMVMLRGLCVEEYKKNHPSGEIGRV